MTERPIIQSSTRTQEESEFYNRYASQLAVAKLAPVDVFAATCLENIQLLEQFGELRGLRVLDIGCGQGDTSVAFALRGAEVWAIDVSDRMIELTRRLAEHHGVRERVHAEVCRVEDMRYPDNFFDLLFADGVLHHLDMVVAVPNLVRVLKPEGRGFFIEPQKGSIFSEIYRFFAKDLRTKDERPFQEQDFDFLGTQFGAISHREYHFSSLVLFALRFAYLRIIGSAFPYWMDDVRQGKVCPRILRHMQRIDSLVLGWLPFLRRFCWLTVIMARK